MISVRKARDTILEDIKPLAIEQININEAVGRVLAESPKARYSKPAFPLSSMDGYAVRGDDFSKPNQKFKVAFEVPAGEMPSSLLKEGQACRVFTGSILPENADTIIIQENVEILNKDINDKATEIIVREEQEKGRYIRPKGLDFEKNSQPVSIKKCLTSRDIALLASMGISWVKVYRQPKIALLATGNELVMPGEVPSASQSINASTFALMSFIKCWGGDYVDLGISKDTIEDVRSVIKELKAVDLVVTCGGISVGDYDHVRRGFAEEGLQIDFWKVAMRPGKPMMYGSLNSIPVLGLPGNPVSTLVCAMLFLRPIMVQMQGLPVKFSYQKAILTSDLEENDDREDYIRSTFSYDVERKILVTALEHQDSSKLTQLALSDCFIIRDPYAQASKKGDIVRILIISDLDNIDN